MLGSVSEQGPLEIKRTKNANRWTGFERERERVRKVVHKVCSCSFAGCDWFVVLENLSLGKVV